MYELWLSVCIYYEYCYHSALFVPNSFFFFTKKEYKTYIEYTRLSIRHAAKLFNKNSFRFWLIYWLGGGGGGAGAAAVVVFLDNYYIYMPFISLVCYRCRTPFLFTRFCCFSFMLLFGLKFSLVWFGLVSVSYFMFFVIVVFVFHLLSMITSYVCLPLAFCFCHSARKFLQSN